MIKNVPRKPVNTRAYLCKLNRYDTKKQLVDCKEAVKQSNLPVIGRHVYKPHELDTFVKELMNDEVALIPRLEGLAEGKGRGIGMRFLINVNRVCAASLYILDVDTGTRSDNVKEWDSLIEAVYNKLTKSNGPLDKKVATAQGKMKPKEPGLVEAWKRKEGTQEYLDNAMVWGDMSIKPAKKAIGMLPDEELRTAAPITITRIFKSRGECAAWLDNQS